MSVWTAWVTQLIDDHRMGRIKLTNWEEEFCQGFIDRGWPTPTEKQRAVMLKMAEKTGVGLPDEPDTPMSREPDDPTRPF